MSFFHVLPSNVAPDYFPKNNASSFSTPIANAYNLEGDWEVALMNVTHSNCIDTFANETLQVEEEEKPSVERLKKLKRPYTLKLDLPEKSDRQSLINYILKEVNPQLKGIVSFSFPHHSTARYEFQSEKFMLILSEDLQSALYFLCDTLSHDDFYKSAYLPVQNDLIFDKETQWSITLVPSTYNERKIVLKAPKEEIDIHTFVKRFNTRIPKKIAYVELDGSQSLLKIMKASTDGIALSLSPDAQKACQFRQRTQYHMGSMAYSRYNFQHYSWHEWSVSLLNIGMLKDFNTLSTTIDMGVRQFQKVDDVCDHLNERIKNEHVKFACNKRNEITVRLKSDSIKLTFDDDLRDILGFDKNMIQGSGLHTASDAISMNRHINYFYIYSNISDNVRIGDTEAPLLAVIPFIPKPCHFVTEKAFKEPMYISVLHKRISQIDIAIYDGAGKLIPFHEGAVTSVRLHFRRK